MRAKLNLKESFPGVKERTKNSGEILFSHTGNSQKGFSAIMELIRFEGLHFEKVRGTFLLITFSFLITEMVA